MARCAAHAHSATPEPRDAQASARGACHGFDVQTDLSIHMLRTADGAHPMPALQIDQAHVARSEPDQAPLYTWSPRPGRTFGGRLYHLSDGFGMWIDGLGCYHVDPQNRRITVPGRPSIARVESRLWGMPAALCFILNGGLSLHAAAIDVNGSALLFIGPGRFGKTTLAAAFMKAGYRVLAEDLCRCMAQPVPSVYPGPAMLRIRWDSYRCLGEIPDTHVVLEDEERVHLAFDPDARGSGSPVPIRGIVALQVSDGPTTLERLSVTEAIPLLWSTSFNFAEAADRARCFTGVSALAGAVPAWRLTRRLEFETLDALIDRVVTTCLP
jgi:hypothetical protein